MIISFCCSSARVACSDMFLSIHVATRSNSLVAVRFTSSAFFKESKGREGMNSEGVVVVMMYSWRWGKSSVGDFAFCEQTRRICDKVFVNVLRGVILNFVLFEFRNCCMRKKGFVRIRA